MCKYINTRKDLKVLKSLIELNLGYKYFEINSEGEKIIKTIKPTKEAFKVLERFHKYFGLDSNGIYDYDYLLQCRKDLIKKLNLKNEFELIEKEYFVSMINKFKNENKKMY